MAMCTTSLYASSFRTRLRPLIQGRCVRVRASSEGTSEAERRLAALKAAREASDRVVSWKPQPIPRSNLSKYLDVKEDPDIGAAPRHVDIRMYDGAMPPDPPVIKQTPDTFALLCNPLSPDDKSKFHTLADRLVHHIINQMLSSTGWDNIFHTMSVGGGLAQLNAA